MARHGAYIVQILLPQENSNLVFPDMDNLNGEAQIRVGSLSDQPTCQLLNTRWRPTARLIKVVVCMPGRTAVPLFDSGSTGRYDYHSTLKSTARHTAAAQSALYIASDTFLF